MKNSKLRESKKRGAFQSAKKSLDRLPTSGVRRIFFLVGFDPTEKLLQTYTYFDPTEKLLHTYTNFDPTATLLQTYTYFDPKSIADPTMSKLIFQKQRFQHFSDQL